MIGQLRNYRLMIWLVLIVLAFIATSIYGQKDQPKEYPLYVSHSPSPSGTKAIYTYLNERYPHVDRWTHEPFLLQNEEKNHLLLLIEPKETPSAEDIVMYEKFMDEGNTIIYFSDHPQEIFDIETTFDTAAESESFTYNGESYDLQIEGFEYLVPSDNDDVLLSNETGTYAFSRSYGEGKLVVVHMASIFTNGSILEEDHAEFLTALIDDVYEEDQHILFNEYVHQTNVVASYIHAYPFWFLVLLFQVAILVLLWLFYHGKRFGPIDTPREEIIRFGDETLSALASWYMRGQEYQDALHMQANYLKQRMHEMWGIPYHLTWQERKPYIERKWKEPPYHVNTFIQQLEEKLADQSLRKADYVRWSKALDQLRREVESE